MLLTPDGTHRPFVDTVTHGNLGDTEAAVSQAADLLPGLRRQWSVAGVRDAVDGIAGCSCSGAGRVMLLASACTGALEGCRPWAVIAVSMITRFRLLGGDQTVPQPQQGCPLVRVNIAQAHQTREKRRPSMATFAYQGTKRIDMLHYLICINSSVRKDLLYVILARETSGFQPRKLNGICHGWLHLPSVVP